MKKKRDLPKSAFRKCLPISPFHWQWSSLWVHSHSWFQVQRVKGMRNALVGDYFSSSKRYRFKTEKAELPFCRQWKCGRMRIKQKILNVCEILKLCRDQIKFYRLQIALGWKWEHFIQMCSSVSYLCTPRSLAFSCCV